MVRLSPLPRLQELAQDQWGLVTRRQIESVGIGATTLDRLTASGGFLERVAHGVYQLVGAPIPDHRDLLLRRQENRLFVQSACLSTVGSLPWQSVLGVRLRSWLPPVACEISLLCLIRRAFVRRQCGAR